MALFFVGCQWDHFRSESVIVLAVESLSFNKVNCIDFEDASSDPNDGFNILCRESVRFTHAFSPSSMSQPSMISLLSGLWPHQHKVSHNGALAMSAREVTIAELALETGYKTAFFSGGPPILRKSGISQGFQLFDDSFGLSKEKLYRNFFELDQIFRSWLSAEVGGQKFLAVFYVADLQIFDEQPTSSNPVIVHSYDGRLSRFRSYLGNFFSHLKKEKLWDSSYVILLGLNGYSDQERFSDLSTTNLHVENTQVALLIKKPQRKARDLGLSWKIDSNTSLVDVSQSLFEIFGSAPKNTDSNFATYSLLRSLDSASADWSQERLMPFESGWTNWKNLGPMRYGLRSGWQLYLHDEKPAVFNTLTDRLESSVMMPGPEWKNRMAHLEATPPLWKGIPQSLLRQVDVAINIWDPSGISGQVHLLDSKDFKTEDRVILEWLALKAIEGSDWNQLLLLGKQKNDKLWSALAQSHLTGKALVPNTECIQWAQRPNFDSQEGRECQDTMFKNLIGWIRSEDSVKELQQYRDAFIKAYRFLILDRRIGQLNFINGLAWDVSEVPQGPVLSEIYLNFPENKKILTQVTNILGSKSEDI